MKPRIVVFIPCYNCSNQIPRVLKQLDAPWLKEHVETVLLVENRSTDDTLSAALLESGKRASRVQVMQNVENYGLGGSHKVAFRYARDNGFDWVLVLHGDDQGSIEDFRPVLENDFIEKYDAILGSRFMKGSSTLGYSRFRVFGNHIFNLIYSVCLRKRIHDLGSGLNLFKVSSVPQNIEKAPDDLTFNCVLLAQLCHAQSKLKFYPISWREDDQISNVKLVRQSIKTAGIALRSLFFGKRYSNGEHRDTVRDYVSVPLS